MSNYLKFIFILSVSVLSACQSKVETTENRPSISANDTKFPEADFPTITEEYVGELVNALAADNMLGRKSGTEGEQLAGDYIAKQFEKIGLTYYEGMDSYFQAFEVLEVSNQQAKAKLNGKSINPKNIFLEAQIAEINWKNPESIETENLSSLGDLRAIGEKLEKPRNTTIVLVSTTLAEEFKSLKQRMSAQTIVASSEKQPVVWILTNKKKVSGLELDFKQEVKKKTFRNVVAVLEGKSKPDEMLFFSAHYDHLGILSPTKEDSVANGADDDASGVSAVISLAKHFKTTQSNERTLVFVAFTAEELGLYGSKYFVNSLNINPKQAIANINIEMIGKQSEFGSGRPFMTGFEKSDLQNILNASLKKTKGEIMFDPYKKYGLFYRSDNASFVEKDIVAHTISTCEIDTDIYYHTVDDEVETLNIPQMTRTIQVLAKAVEPLVIGTAKPKWTKEK
ncbi:MAG: hypothetical protein ACJAWV_004332 [Flammeovirgaceae bacterium]|jgi:hypothetical protein